MVALDTPTPGLAAEWVTENGPVVKVGIANKRPDPRSFLNWAQNQFMFHDLVRSCGRGFAEP